MKVKARDQESQVRTSPQEVPVQDQIQVQVQEVPQLQIDWVRICWSPDDGKHCCAVACVSYAIHETTRRLDWLSSGGLGGIEAPDAAYRREVEAEQLADLRDHLQVFGLDVTDEEWARLIRGRFND